MSLKPVITPTSALIFKDISVRGFWMSKWIENNFDNPARAEMYEELAEMAVHGKLSPPKNFFVPLSEGTFKRKGCSLCFNPARVLCASYPLSNLSICVRHNLLIFSKVRDPHFVGMRS